jgi:organic radical activating enzyme
MDILVALLPVKNLLREIIPFKILNKLQSMYFEQKKFKKQNWMLLHLFITGKCNLNCKSCGTFAPIAYNYLLDIVSFESDCRRLSELGAEKFPGIQLLGGEPLLHPKLNEIIIIARSHFPKTNLSILTNGTLLLKQKEDFWECCQSNKVEILITHYPISLDIKSIRKKIKKYRLKLRYCHSVAPWYKVEYDLTGGSNPEDNFRKCNNAIQCAELCDGKIVTCSSILCIKYFNAYFQKNIEVKETDFIDIYKVKAIDEILEFISKPVSFCRYCTLKGLPAKWELSKRDISEWT